MNDLLRVRLVGALPSPQPFSTQWLVEGLLTLQWLSPPVALAATQEFPPPESTAWHKFTGPLEEGKQEGQAMIAGDTVETIHATLAGLEFVSWLREITGIPDLTSDLDRVGSGIHQSGPGGRLGMHTDFNLHPHDRDLVRAVNVIVFLDDASFDYEAGGWFEWERRGVVLPDDLQAASRLRPRPGLMVLFAANDWTYHGHPVPIAEDGPLRRSIPAYYFRPRREGEEIQPHSTLFLDAE